MSEREKDYQKAMHYIDVHDSSDLLDEARNTVGAFVDELKQTYRDSRKCAKCGCQICGDLKCWSCVSDAPQESRDINERLTIENEKLRAELFALKSRVENAPKVWIQRNTITGGIVCIDEGNASDLDKREMDCCYAVPVDEVPDAE